MPFVAAPPTVKATIPPTAPPRAPRRWLACLGWTVGTLLALAFVLLAAAWFYWLSLIRTYTSDKAEPVPRMESAETRYAELSARWDAYIPRLVQRQETVPAFELTGEDLNLLVNRAGPLRNKAHVEIRPPHLRIQFSIPLDQTGNPRLQGRFLNGVAQLAPEYSGRQLHLRIVALDANRKPIPGWILRRLQRTNWGEALNRRPEFDLAVQALERIELQPDRLVLHPAAGAR